MLFDCTDKLFEAAARDPVQRDKLILRFRRIRSCFFVTLLLVLVALIGFAVWMFSQVFLMLRSQFLETTPFLQQLGSFGSFNILLVTVVVISVFTSVLNGMMAADTRVKMLLLLRAFRDDGTARTKDVAGI